MMKKTKFLLVILALVTTLLMNVLNPLPAKAAFNPNNLIDDFTFDNTNALASAPQIDTWLNNNFGSASCISWAHGFSAPDPQGYSPTNGFQFGSLVSAGQVIFDAAQAYNLNPQVLLTTLQKEQSLVSGGSGCGTLQYTGAMGYGCPDGGTTYNYSGLSLYAINGVMVSSVNGTCVNSASKAGFSQQVIHAAWLLKFGEQRSEGNTGWAIIKGSWDNSDDPNTCYGGPMVEGYLKRCSSDPSTTYYDGYTTIDGTATHMDDGATASLYWYTPHFAGNQNFDTIFNQYFGSQFANDTFTPHPNGTLVVSGGKIYLVSNNTLQWITNGSVFDSYGYIWNQVKTGTTGDASLPVGTSISTLAPGTIFRTDNSPIYVMTYQSGSLVKQQISLDAFNNLGYLWSDVIYVPPSFVPAATASNILFAYQHPAGTLVADSSSGKVYLLDQSSKRWVLGPNAFLTNNYDWSNVKTATPLDLSQPDGSTVDMRQGAMVSSGGNVYVINYDGSGIFKQPVGPYECFANRWHYTSADLYQVSALPTRTGSLATC